MSPVSPGHKHILLHRLHRVPAKTERPVPHQCEQAEQDEQELAAGERDGNADLRERRVQIANLENGS